MYKYLKYKKKYKNMIFCVSPEVRMQKDWENQSK